MYEGEEVNSIDLIYEKKTTEKNGVKVIVPVKWENRHEFPEKIQEQLAYFENVFFNVEGIDNEFLIHRSTTFQFSELSKDQKLHVCLDNVYYPLDFDKLGIDTIRIPLGLRFSLTDKLFPTPNRESLIYNKQSKEIILNKIKELSNFIINKFNSELKETQNIHKIISYYKYSSKHLTMLNATLDISNLAEYSTVSFAKPSLKKIKTLKIDQLLKLKTFHLLSNYSVKYELKSGRMSEINNRHWRKEVKWNDNLNKNNYIFSSTFKGIKKTYVKHLERNNSGTTIRFIKKTFDYELGNRFSTGYQTYYEILGLKTYPKSQWRQVIKDFQYIQSLLLKDYKSVDDLIISEKWLEDRKKARLLKTRQTISNRGPKLEGEIICKKAEELLKYSQDRNCKFVSHKYDVQEIPKLNKLIVYAHHDDQLKLDVLFKAFEYSKLVDFVSFSSRELKLVENENINNLINYDTFMKGETDQFKKLVTAYLIYLLNKDFSKTLKFNNFLETVSKDLQDKIKMLNAYKNSHLENYPSGTAYTEMLKVAEKFNLYDESIYSVFKEVKTILEENPFIETIIDNSPFHDSGRDKMIEILISLIKLDKIQGKKLTYEIKLNK